LTGMNLEIGDEHAIFLAGSLPIAAVNDAELDRVLGSMWAYVEKVFRPALRIGFASRFSS
ncbi:MAG: YbjN domain-containing protein, partial [Acidimicrobiaceae bacterium]